jgi:hypothetical protein
MTKTAQLHISQDVIEKYMMSENELHGGLTVNATLEEESVVVDVWCVDASTNEEVKIKSNRLNVGPNGIQAAFILCIFLGIFTYFTKKLLYAEWVGEWVSEWL